MAELEAWMRGERAKLSCHAPVAQAIDHLLKRWNGFTRFLEDGRVCLANNAAEERALYGWRPAARRGSSPVQTVTHTAPPSCTR